MGKITIINPKRFGSALPDSPENHRIALGKGLEELGFKVNYAPPGAHVDTKHVACWGWRQGKTLRAAGHEVLVMERGYIGDRFKYTSLAWNGLNGHAEFPGYSDDGGQRFKQHGGFIKPWKTAGANIIIMGQVRGDASLQGKDIRPWYDRISIIARKEYKLPVFFRAHPEAPRRGGYYQIDYADNINGTLQQALDRSHFTVCYNSNSAVDSVLAGVPCVVGDKGTMAYDMCSEEIETLVYPERESWAHKLAWTQWEIEEIRSGNALKKLLEMKGI